MVVYRGYVTSVTCCDAIGRGCIANDPLRAVSHIPCTDARRGQLSTRVMKHIEGSARIASGPRLIRVSRPGARVRTLFGCRTSCSWGVGSKPGPAAGWVGEAVQSAGSGPAGLYLAGFDELMPKTLATGTVDRLLHQAHIFQISGDPVRLSQALTGKGVTPLI